MEQKKEIMKKTKEYIKRNLNETNLTLDHISKQIGYSKFHLSRIFKEESGISIHKYIQKCRLEESADQLMNTEIPIVDIAFHSGYQSQQAFTLAFRQVYLCTPQIYRTLQISKRSPKNKIRRCNSVSVGQLYKQTNIRCEVKAA